MRAFWRRHGRRAALFGVLYGSVTALTASILGFEIGSATVGIAAAFGYAQGATDEHERSAVHVVIHATRRGG